MHQLHQPWGVSLAQVIEQIAALGQQRPVPRSHARIDSADLLALSPTQRDEAAGRLLDVARKGGWTTTGENDPWYGASIVGEQQAEDRAPDEERQREEDGARGRSRDRTAGRS